MPVAATEWLGEFTANTSTPGIQDDVQTFQLANGDFWVTWHDTGTAAPANAPFGEILGQLYDPLGVAIGGAVRLNGGFYNGDESNAAFAANVGSSGFVMLYEANHSNPGNPPNVDIVFERHNADGSMVNGTAVASDPDGAGGSFVANPALAIASATSGLMVWEQSNGAGDTDIMARAFDPSGSFSPAFTIWNQTDNSYDAHVTALKGGNYAVVWTDEYNGSATDLDVRGAIYTQGGTLVTQFNAAYSNRMEHESSITALTSGGFVVSYTDGTTGNGDVTAKIFDASGVQQGATILVAASGDVEGKSSVAATNDGGFVVTWVDETAHQTVMATYSSAGVLMGTMIPLLDGAAASGPVSATALADGRILFGYEIASVGDAFGAIFDPRSGANNPVYAPKGWQIGTTGDDTIYVSSGSGEVHGWTGNDIIVDLAGTSELLAGDAGDDHIVMNGIAAGRGADGGEGIDTLSLINVHELVSIDLYHGTLFTDTLSLSFTGFEHFDSAGLDHTVSISGTDAANHITTGSGNDLLDGGAGADVLTGGLGDDIYIVDQAGDTIVEKAGEGTDTVQTAMSYSLVGTNIEDIKLLGTADVNARGNEFANYLLGNIGANTLNGGAGADLLQGLEGNDRYIVDDAGDVVLEVAGGGTDRVDSSISYTLTANVENLTLTGSAAIDGTGNALDNAIQGNSNVNHLDGGAGADTMKGGKGDDFYVVDNAGDVVVENDGEGSDTIDSSVSYSLAGQYVEVLNLTGHDAINGTGNSLANRIVGNDAANILVGGDGSDRLDGGAGADVMKGGTGHDVYVVDNALDKIVENDGEGTDTVEAYFSYSLAGQFIEILKLMGTDNLNGTGNGLANTLYGNAGNNTLNGGTGADVMYGGAGDDTYVVDNAGDQVFEANGEGMDTVLASVSFVIGGQYVETVTLTGSAAINATGNSQANTLNGNNAANVLSGGGGADQLHGGLGSDTLTGGAGADTYWFETALGPNNVDKITDFAAVDDTINLDRSIFTGIATDGMLDASAFWQGAAAHDADDRIVYDKASGKIWYDADGSGAGAAVLFAQVNANTVLTAADFFAVP